MIVSIIAGYEIDDDPCGLNLDAIWAFLSTEAYWHRWRSREQVEAQIASSWRVTGAYFVGQQVGFARAMSDGVAIGYLADVYVLASHRGVGLGAALVRAVVEGEGASFRWMLHTYDAHGLYRKFGFTAPPETYMERSREPSGRR